MKEKGKEAADISRYLIKNLSLAKTHIYMKLYSITCSLLHTLEAKVKWLL